VSSAWDLRFERHCHELAGGVVGRQGPERLRAWQSLLVAVAPHIETWAARQPSLRALRLTSEDELRAVLVRVVERLQRGQHESLRVFLEERGEAPATLERIRIETGDADLAHRFSAVALAAGLTEDEPQDDVVSTPLRAWIKGLVKYAALDHAVARLGRPQRAQTPSDTQVLDKRLVNSGAKRFSEGDAGSMRPEITDLLTLKRVAGEIHEFIAERLPAEQQRALQLRLDDRSYVEIAAELSLSSASIAEQLVRAAKERLRAEFRGQRERFGLDE
jgi:DNA-directed RNA polymerase specialized sigma24 family protein